MDADCCFVQRGTMGKVHIKKIDIPDVWHIAGRVEDSETKHNADMIRDTWAIAHDLKRHIEKYCGG